MRIIAGTARGTQLFAPEGMDTRPTRDQVKESLFNIIQGELPEAAVLDLFAGSGALGLESISRGAARAVLADRAKEAVKCIRRNVEKLRFDRQATVMECDWTQAVARLAGDGARFDIVFLDPPYRMTELGEICQALADGGLLQPDALMVLEHGADWQPRLGEAFVLMKERSYRDTEIHFFRFVGRQLL